MDFPSAGRHMLPLVLVVMAVMVLGSMADNYVTKYDNINLEEIFNSSRLMNNYMNCLKNVGPCTPDGKELKNNLPDALMSDCVKCSEKQRIGSDKVIKFIIANRPDDFATLEQLYDPTGEYRRKYLAPDGTLKPREDGEEDVPPVKETNDGDIEIDSVAHATEHKTAPSQDHDHGEGHTDESKN
ncbi:AGAP008055-PA-like protein [Anopheles sinensis]|uniref:AGAP008055-PA-like protein n=1 Tax=Anopheles sinensis TaxID=74873 RepID=A0A084VNC3_ANOSI|nr:AGAP008055-PA-like protein [Anopheles sinensis]